jgi:predicted Zn-dependent peptidase
VSHQRVVELATPMFSEMVDSALPSVSPYDPALSGERVVIDSRAIDQCTMYLGLPMFGRDDPDRFAIRIMNDVLGAGMSSRLFREVRERRGLAYSVGSGYGYLADAGVFTVSAGVNRDKLRETISVCLEETEKLSTEIVPPDELRKAKDHNIGRFRLSLETAFSLGQRHGELLLTKGEIESIESVVEKIEAVDVDQVQAVARRILLREKLHCAVVGPDLDEAEISAAIA